MDEDHRELVRRLFATATAMLEDATEFAAEGQSPKVRRSRAVDLARRLRAATIDIAAIAEAARIAVDHGRNSRQIRRNSRQSIRWTSLGKEALVLPNR